jgi:hypothetical protein
MKKRNALAGTLILPLLLIAVLGLAETNSGDITEAAVTTSINATAAGSCVTSSGSGGEILVDSYGLVRCNALSTTDPTDVLVRSGACYELDDTCTAPDLNLVAGIDTKQFTSVTFANCANGDTARTVVVDRTGATLANCDCVVGTSWTCATDNDTCAAGLDACVEACAGVSSQVSTNTVGVRPDASAVAVTLSMPTDAGSACAVVSNGTSGNIDMRATAVYFPDGTSTVPSIAFASDTNTGFTTNSVGDVLYATTGGTARWLFGATNVSISNIDARGDIADSTGNLTLNDIVDVGSTLYARHATSTVVSFGTSGDEYFGVYSTEPRVRMSTANTTISYRHWAPTVTTGNVSATESGRSENNTGASARADRTLPDAPTVGFIYRAFVNDTDGIKIIANTGDTIYVAGVASAAAGYICSATVGTSVTCEAVSATVWVCDTNGTWAMDLGC